VQTVVRELVSRVVLDFYQVPKAKKVSSVCTGGTIDVRTQEGITLPGQCAESSNGHCLGGQVGSLAIPFTRDDLAA
jgi:hypothetical protein